MNSSILLWVLLCYAIELKLSYAVPDHLHAELIIRLSLMFAE